MNIIKSTCFRENEDTDIGDFALTKWTIALKWKEGLSNNNRKKIIKIGAFLQMLSWSKGITCVKILEKIVEKLKI